jgi:hypothetical protein
MTRHFAWSSSEYGAALESQVMNHMLNGRKTSDDMMGGLVGVRVNDERLVYDVESGCHFRSDPLPL